MAKKVNKQEASIQELIDNTAEKTVAKAVKELKKQGLLKDNRSAFQKTETLLYNYKNFKDVIENKYKQIDTIMVAGSNKKSSSITTYSSNNVMESRLEEERVEEQITKIEQSIATTLDFIKIIDNAIDKLKDDPYFEIIELKYFKDKPREEIAEYFDVHEKTITRNKNRLINKLKIEIFSEEAIIEMLY